MSHDPERIAQLLDAAAGLPQTDRNAFLETACGGDHELRRLVAELLSTREFSDSSLETPTAIQSGFENHELATAAYAADPDATITGPDAQAAADTLNADPAPSVSQTEATSKAAPQVVIAGRYALVELLGQGGMGEVWVAQQSEPVKRRVALKLIKGGMDSRDVVNRFEAERQALAMMDHPSIARILDGGLTEGRLPFFVMELVDGQPLSKYCDAARLTIRQRLELFVLICKGVQHAHQKGIVHRDLKPGNILVGLADGHPVPKVIDFGLAKATQGKLTEETMATTYGAVVGTLDYMSPEQAGLSGGDVDTRSDIYSLGVILYELLTGLRPIESKLFKPGGLTEVLRKIQQDEPPRPSARLVTAPKLVQLAAARQAEPRQLTALLRGELDWVVMKCLEKQRDRRYETVNALARDVERYLADEPVEARPPNAKYRIGKFLQRNKGPVFAASLVLLALVGGIIGTAIGLVRAMRAEEVLADEARRADDARKEAERQLAHGLIAQGDALSLASRIPEAYARYKEAYDKFVELKEPLLVPEAALWDLAERTGLPLLRTEIRESVSCIEITPDNRTALIGTDGGALWSWDLASGRRLRVFDGHTGWISRVAISPDGATAVSASADKTIRLWDLASGRTIRTFLGHLDDVTDVALSPDGKTALSASRDKTLKLWNLREGQELRSFTGHSEDVLCVAISPDGLTAVSGSADKTLRLWDLATGELRHTFAGLAAGVTGVAISSDGQLALSGSSDGTMKLWDLERRIERRTFLGHTDFVTRVVFTPDGHAAFSGSHDGTLRLWDLESGKSLRTFGDVNRVTSAGISPDGRVALSGSHGQPRNFALTLWNLAEGKERRHWKGGRIPVSNIVFAPDGRSAISDGWGTTMKSRDLASGHVLKTVPRDQSERAWFLFDADSQSALAKNFGEKTLFVLDLTTGEIAQSLSGHTDQVSCATLSRDGRTALSGSEDATLKLWDLASGSELRTFVGHSGPVRCVALSPDGRAAISGSDDKTLRLWDLVSGKTLRSFDGNAGVLSVSIAADGVTALFAGADNTVKLGNLESGELLRTMSGHTEPVYAAKMTNDGRFALSTGYDKTVRLWDLASGKELRTFRDHTDPIVSLGISPDDRTALSGDIDGNVWLWDVSRATANRELERRVVAAQAALLKDTSDPHAEASLGEWYAFRGLDQWGMEFLIRARDRGVSDTAATLARCYWNLGQFADAQREFQTLVEQSADTAQREYFSQCLLAVNEEIERARRREVAVTAQPLTEADIERISGLSATAQIAEIQAELQKRNPEFDGEILPTMENDWVIHLVVPMEHVTDISPLRSLTRLRSLELQRSADLATPEPVDLASLMGLPLKQLNIAHCAVSDLAPLVGMPLDDLNLLATRVSDLSSLRGMRLIRLNLMKCPVSDLSPLAGMPLETLNLDFTQVVDLTPLREMRLKRVTVDGAPVVHRFEAEALRFEQAGDWRGVTEVWRNAVETYALEDYNVSVQWVLSLTRIHDFAGAIGAYQAALTFTPDRSGIGSYVDTGGLARLRNLRDSILDAFAMVGRLDDAIELGRELVQETPDNPYTWYRLAILLALSEDRAGYRDHCRRMNQQFANSPDELPRWMVCAACLLGQDGELTQLAQNTLSQSDVMKKTPENPILRSATLWTRAMLALRQGEAKMALEHQQNSAKCILMAPVDSSDLKEPLQSTKEVGAMMGPQELQTIRAKHLAMISLAQHQLNQSQEARALLRQSEEIFNSLEKDNPDTLYDRLEYQLLVREARRALGVPEPN